MVENTYIPFLSVHFKSKQKSPEAKEKVGMRKDMHVKTLTGYLDFSLGSKGTVRECFDNTPKSPQLTD